jgi:hypothetical protein
MANMPLVSRIVGNRAATSSIDMSTQIFQKHRKISTINSVRISCHTILLLKQRHFTYKLVDDLPPT